MFTCPWNWKGIHISNSYFPKRNGFFYPMESAKFSKDCVHVKARKRDAIVWTKRGGIELYSGIFSATQGFFLPLNLRVWPFSSEPFVSFLSEKKKKERFYRSLSFISSLNFFCGKRMGEWNALLEEEEKKMPPPRPFFLFPLVYCSEEAPSGLSPRWGEKKFSFLLPLFSRRWRVVAGNSKE